jgi:hypothetical protein
MTTLPIYLKCRFFDAEDASTVYTFKIGASGVEAHPFQLYRLKDDGLGNWENLSVYASVDDAVMVLLKELLSAELTDEIYHGQATINPAEIIEKINFGERTIAIFNDKARELFRLDIDVSFKDLIERN